MPTACRLVHATAIAIERRAALIVGPSGAGKSELALRLLTSPVSDGGRMLHATLVADDQVLVERRGERLLARPPETIAGRLEVRGLGILPFPYAAGIQVDLVVDIDPAGPFERLPDPPARYSLLGLEVPLIRLDARHAVAPAKVALALARGPLGAA